MKGKRLSQEVLGRPSSENFWIGLIKEEWLVDEKVKTYYLYWLPDVVQVMGVTPRGNIVVIKEFQPAVGADYVHLVGETLRTGGGDETGLPMATETPIQAAERGLLEETGYCAEGFELVTSVFENTGRSHRLIHLVMATGCQKARPGEKEIQTREVSPAALWRSMHDYYRANPEKGHGGGNSLKLVALAFERFGLLKICSDPVLYVVCGWPLSGKSSVARMLSQEMNIPWFDIDDDARFPIFGEPDPHPDRSEEVMKLDVMQMGASYRILMLRARDHLSSGRSVIITATFSRVIGQDRITDLIQDFPEARLRVVWLKPSSDTPEEVQALIEQRAKGFGEGGYTGAVNSPERYYEVRNRYEDIGLSHLVVPTWPQTSVEESVRLALEHCRS